LRQFRPEKPDKIEISSGKGKKEIFPNKQKPLITHPSTTHQGEGKKPLKGSKKKVLSKGREPFYSIFELSSNIRPFVFI